MSFVGIRQCLSAHVSFTFFQEGEEKKTRRTNDEPFGWKQMRENWRRSVTFDDL